MQTSPAWPALPPYLEWEKTCTTLHLWTQVVGKIRLALAPHVNHFWSSTLYVSSSGFTTSPVPHGTGSFTIDFDFLHHVLRLYTSYGDLVSFPLLPMSVAEFYSQTMSSISTLGIDVQILARPVEMAESTPFAEDTVHRSYDPEAVCSFWRSLVCISNVFGEFRALFTGKSSPVHLFWGSLDLALTRFSGRTAPKHPGGIPNCADWVAEEAYSHEESSAGFWAGAGLGEAAFYSYAYPAPPGFSDWKVEPEAAYYHDKLGEFILPYEAIRTNNPEASLTAFLQSTYEGAATLGKWDRAALDKPTDCKY